MVATGNTRFARDTTQQPTSDHLSSLSNKCHVQLLLKKDGDPDVQRRMLNDLRNYQKFLFSGDQHWRLGFDPNSKFMSMNWDYDRIDMEAPEYTPSTHTITLNFMISGYPFPEGIIEILNNNGWTVTGRYCMGYKSRKTQEIVWGPWDYHLYESSKRVHGWQISRNWTRILRNSTER